MIHGIQTLYYFAKNFSSPSIGGRNNWNSLLLHVLLLFALNKSVMTVSIKADQLFPLSQKHTYMYSNSTWNIIFIAVVKDEI